MMATTTSPPRCRWCDRASKPGKGGKTKLYCGTDHKNAHSAARQAWAQEQERHGLVTRSELEAALARSRGSR
jgi:hypothetical protein